MRHLERLVQLCFLWHVIKIIETHGEMLSSETIFQLQKHPAANRDDADVIKNISKIFYDHNHTPDEAVIECTYNSTRKNNDNNPAELFNIFKQIERKEAVDESDIHVVQFVAKQPPKENHRSQYEVQPFSILQQLRLDEQQQQQQQKQQKQQQNVLELQHIMHKLDTETLSKAAKKKKKKKKRRKKKKKKPAKKKKRKKNKQKPTNQQTSLISHPAHVLFASPTQQRPLHYYHQQHDPQATTTTTATTTKHPFKPIKKIKYILRKNTIFKKKKKEYLSHLKHVLYPFVKFIAFFTVLNPFTLAVFLFSLISPVVFGFLGFIGLSFLIKPALNLLFGIKHTVNTIKRRKLKELRRRQRLRDRRRPITIHKHYYQQQPIRPPSAAPHRPIAPKPKGPFHHHSLRLGNRHQHTRKMKLFNPLLPDIRQILKKDKYIFPDIKGYNDSFEQF